MRNSITLMIIASLFGLSVVAMSLTAFVNLHKFGKAFEAALNDRYLFVLNDVRESLEAEMRVGLALENLSNAQPLLDEAQRRDPAILSVEIFDRDGRTIHSTDRSFLLDIVPTSWEQAWRNAADGHWNVNERDAVAVGIGLNDVLGNPAGGLVLRYSSVARDRTLESLRAIVIERAVWLCVGVAVIIFLLVTYLTRQLKDYFHFLEDAVSSLLGSEGPVTDVVVEGVEDSHVHEFIDGYRGAENQVAELEGALRRLDEEA